jgi:hypothetical protein
VSDRSWFKPLKFTERIVSGGRMLLPKRSIELDEGQTRPRGSVWSCLHLCRFRKRAHGAFALSVFALFSEERG